MVTVGEMMARFIRNVLWVLMLIVCIFPSFGVAMSAGGTDAINQDEIAAVWEKLDFEKIDEPEIKEGFSCFDVNESGDYALGFDLGNRDAVLLYNVDTGYLRGFSFTNNGSFGVKLDGESIAIYLVRSDLVVSLDSNGNCLKMEQIQNTVGDSEDWRKEVNANKRIVNGVAFTAEHWLLNNELLHWGSYPRLVKTMPDGEQTVLFDTTAHVLVRNLTIAIFAGIAISLAVIIPTVRRVKRRKDSGQ